MGIYQEYDSYDSFTKLSHKAWLVQQFMAQKSTKKRVFHWAPHFATGTALCRQEVDDLAEAVHVVPQLKAAWPKKSSEARGVGMRLT